MIIDKINFIFALIMCIEFSEKIFQEEVSPLAKLVYIYLNREKGDDKKVSVSNRELGDCFGKTGVRISVVLKELSDMGYIRMSGQKKARTFEIIK